MENNLDNRKPCIEIMVALLLMARVIELCAESVVTSIRGLSGLMVIVRPIEEIIYLVGFVLLVVFYFNHSYEERIKSHTLLKTFFLVCGMVVVYAFTSANNAFIVSNFRGLFFKILIYGAIFYFAASITVDYNKVFYYLRFGVVLSIIYGFISALVLNLDYMVIASVILLHTMVAYHLYKSTSEMKYFLLFVVLCGLIAVAGSRGALLWLIVFYLMYNICLARGITKKGVIVVVVLLLGLFFSVAFQTEIISILIRLFPNSRTIEMLALSNIADDSSRSNIWSFFINEISQNPFKIHGLFADRAAINQTFMNTNKLGYWITETRSYSYAHDLFLEILYDFGVVIGGFISVKIVSLVVRIIRFAKETDDINEAGFYIVIVVYGFLMLLISDSFLLNVYFWFFLGLINKVPKRKRFRIGEIYL